MLGLGLTPQVEKRTHECVVMLVIHVLVDLRGCEIDQREQAVCVTGDCPICALSLLDQKLAESLHCAHDALVSKDAKVERCWG